MKTVIKLNFYLVDQDSAQLGTALSLLLRLFHSAISWAITHLGSTRMPMQMPNRLKGRILTLESTGLISSD